MFHGDKHVITGACRVIWDGITNPDRNPPGGGIKYSLKVAMPAAFPEAAELQQILDAELQTGQFKGTLPPGALPGISDVQPGEFNNMLQGHKVFNSATYGSPPEVYDINGQLLDPMTYGSMFYPGSTVQLILSARSYNNVSKGLGFWLNGIKVVDATSPKIPVGNGIDAGKVFGGAAAPGAGTQPAIAGAPSPAATMPMGAPPPAPAAPAPAAPAAPAPAYDFLTVDGKQFTPDQLRAAGWSEAQINGLRT